MLRCMTFGLVGLMVWALGSVAKADALSDALAAYAVAADAYDVAASDLENVGYYSWNTTNDSVNGNWPNLTTAEKVAVGDIRAARLATFNAFEAEWMTTVSSNPSGYGSSSPFYWQYSGYRLTKRLLAEETAERAEAIYLSSMSDSTKTAELQVATGLLNEATADFNSQKAADTCYADELLPYCN